MGKLEAYGALHSVMALGRKYRFEEQHARQVTRLALQLFDQLTALHGLGEPERRVLEAAGWLHDVGQYVAYARHHKHSHYLIMHAELPGFDARQRGMIAAIARYHRKSAPRAAHAEFAALAPDDQRRVRMLAALLRLADALDRSHAGAVRGVRASASRARVRLSVDAGGSTAAEHAALAHKAELFRDAFGRDLVVDGI